MTAQRARLVWKYEFTDDDGTEIGPLWIDTFGDDAVKPASTEDLGWTTREQARTIAERRGCEFRGRQRRGRVRLTPSADASVGNAT